MVNRMIGDLRIVRQIRGVNLEFDFTSSFCVSAHTESIEFELSNAAAFKLHAPVRISGPWDSQTPLTASVWGRHTQRFSAAKGDRRRSCEILRLR